MFPAAGCWSKACCFLLRSCCRTGNLLPLPILAMKNWIMQIIPSTTSQLVQFIANQESDPPEQGATTFFLTACSTSSQPYSTSRARLSHLVVDNDVYHNNNKLWLPMFEMCWETVGLGSQRRAGANLHIFGTEDLVRLAIIVVCLILLSTNARNIRLVSL